MLDNKTAVLIWDAINKEIGTKDAISLESIQKSVYLPQISEGNYIVLGIQDGDLSILVHLKAINQEISVKEVQLLQWT